MRAAAAVLLALACAPEASAWGPTGHRAIGRVAERHLSPAAARAVKDLLAPEQLAYVTTWSDEIRSEAEWSKADPWHYTTVPDGQPIEAATKNPAGDVLEAIARFEKVLGDRTAPRGERAQALKWLAHLIGDLHQPMHVGRGDDRGGNETVVLWFGEPSNLHSVWDSKIVEQSELSFTELAELVDHPTPDELRAWQATRFPEWARESQELRAGAYAIGDRRLSWKYLHDQWPVVQRRILQAGVRLSATIERLLAQP
ncbi:MAG: S1/P1 nuclease [Vicinamibacteria bacterium]